MKAQKILAFATLLMGVLTSCKGPAPLTADQIVEHINNPSSKRVLVIAHRGDWRNNPENSIAAIESAIAMGVDIVAIDLKLTKDSVLVLCHDKTVNRTTNGKGLVSDYTLDSLKQLRLKQGHGVAGTQQIPTLKEALEVCKDRIVVNLDHAYDYYDLALKVCEEVGVTHQCLMKGSKPAAEVAQKFAFHKNNMMYMPIIPILKPEGKRLFEEYMDAGQPPLAYEVCWPEMTPEVQVCMQQVLAQGSKLWVNSLWASLNGGMDDDAAYYSNNPDSVYGLLIDLGATMIQTDRPEYLIDYLRKKGLHN